MTFDWRGDLALADRLAAETEDEAALRSAVSRAYYAAYHRASQLVRERELVASSVELRHTVVWRLLKDQPSISFRRAGDRGFQLKHAWVQADYMAPNSPDPRPLRPATRFGRRAGSSN